MDDSKKKSKKSVVKKVLKICLISILSIILVFNIYILIQAKSKPNKVPSIFGYKPFVVLSGSMEPKINKGDLIFVKKVNTEKLKEKDIIAFRNPDKTVTTHRITSVIKTSNNICFETKGDNNNIKDEDVICKESVEGKYVSKISKVGNVVIFVQEPLGFAVMMLTLFIICTFIYFAGNSKIDSEMIIKDKEELEAFKEFKKAKLKEKKKNEKK